MKKKTLCRLCGSKKSREKFNKNKYVVLKCLDCGFIYLNYQPSLKDLKNFYQKDYFIDGIQKMGYYDYLSERETIIKNSQKRLGEIEGFIKPGRLLDIGCACGFFLKTASTVWETSGVEISPFAASWASNNLELNIFPGDLKEANFPSSHFEAVTCWDTIEHLTHPKETLLEIRRILKKGGILALSTGDIGSFLAKISGVHWHLLNLPQHLSFFDKKRLTPLLENSGFRILKIKNDGNWYSLPYLLFSLKTRSGGKIFSWLYEKIYQTSWGRKSLYLKIMIKN